MKFTDDSLSCWFNYSSWRLQNPRCCWDCRAGPLAVREKYARRNVNDGQRSGFVAANCIKSGAPPRLCCAKGVGERDYTPRTDTDEIEFPAFLRRGF